MEDRIREELANIDTDGPLSSHRLDFYKTMFRNRGSAFDGERSSGLHGARMGQGRAQSTQAEREVVEDGEDGEDGDHIGVVEDGDHIGVGDSSHETAVSVGNLGGTHIDDETYFVLIPGSSLLFGQAKVDEEKIETAEWQRNLEKRIIEGLGEDHILKSNKEYTGTGEESTCGSVENKPYQCRKQEKDGCADEQYNCVENTLINHADKKKSVVSTSQGSAVFFSCIIKNPELLDNIDSILLFSPALSFNGTNNCITKDKIKGVLNICKEKGIRILLVDNEYGYSHYDEELGEYFRNPMTKVIKEYCDKEDNDSFNIFVKCSNHSFNIEGIYSVNFVNNLNRDLTLHWVRGDGTLNKGVKLMKNGGSNTMKTYAGHVWMARHEEKEIFKLEIDAGNGGFQKVQIDSKRRQKVMVTVSDETGGTSEDKSKNKEKMKKCIEFNREINSCFQRDIIKYIYMWCIAMDAYRNQYRSEILREIIVINSMASGVYVDKESV